MNYARRILACQTGAAVVELAFALPVLIIMIWMMVQLGQVFRASAGIQQALGQGARYATLCINPSTISGCGIPTGQQVHDKMVDSVYGIGPGTFVANTPTKQTSGTGAYYDLSVNYTQPTSLLILPGPDITISRSKRVWVAGT